VIVVVGPAAAREAVAVHVVEVRTLVALDARITSSMALRRLVEV
jgi:hypothetical protein